MECGFMDSFVDCPIILSEEYAQKLANAFADVIISKIGAQKKAQSSSKGYAVQIGYFDTYEQAEAFARVLSGSEIVEIDQY